MALESNQDRVKQEASLYIQLGTLMNKVRSPENRAAVQKIVDSRAALPEKISRIEDLDNAAKARRHKIFILDGDNVLKSTNKGKSVEHALKNRSHLKMEPIRIGFFKYFFKERSILIRAAKRGDFLRCGFFSVEFKRNTLQSLQDTVLRHYNPLLLEACDFVLQEGWRYLTKQEYNLAAALRHLVHQVLHCEFKSAALPGGTLGRFGELESSWLFFQSAANLPDMTIDAFGRVLGLSARLGKLQSGISDTIATLLFPNRISPAIADFVLALNMQRSRRALAIKDLIRPSSELYLAMDDFDCTPSVQSDINEAIAETARHLAETSKKLLDFSRLKFYLPTGPENTTEFLALKLFYCSYTGQSSDQFESFSENTLAFSCTLIQAFLQSAEPLLYRFKLRSPAEKQGSPERYSLDYEGSRMRFLYEKLLTLQTVLPVLPQSRFQSLCLGSQDPSQPEVEALKLLDELSGLFFKCGQKLSLVAAAAASLAETGVMDANAKTNKLDALDPFLLERLADRDTFISSTTIAYLSATWFLNPEILEMLKNERILGNERKGLIQKIDRLANREQWQVLNEQLDMEIQETPV